MIYNKLFIGAKSSLILFIARDNSFVNKNIKNSLLDKTSVQIHTCHFIADQLLQHTSIHSKSLSSFKLFEQWSKQT